MAIKLLGKKRGMTRIFTDDGRMVPVTVIEVQPNRVAQIKSVDTDGYCAIQTTAGSVRSTRLTKQLAGHFAKAGVVPGSVVSEFRVNDTELASYQLAAELKVDVFEPGQLVDVIGVTIGKGFAGVIKRYHFSMQDATHGNSLSHRAPGSIGQRQTPGRVVKGKKMAGHLGNKQRTAQNLEVVRVDVERNLLLIKGAVPGAKGSDVAIRSAVTAG